eukprot:1789154-Amphidinium_carterae.1
MLAITFSCAAIASCNDSCVGGADSEVTFSGVGLRDDLGAPHSRQVARVAKLLLPHAQFQSSREGLLELRHG